jgi:peroxiredoxin
VRIGQPAPRFLFEFAPGRELPLSKLAGQPLVLVFWKSSSRPSINAVLNLQKTSGKPNVQAPIVLAINDGESPELARGVAAESGMSATLVTDPKREIALAYGVSLWPTVVTVNASGMISGIAYGHVST